MIQRIGSIAMDRRKLDMEGYLQIDLVVLLCHIDVLVDFSEP